MAQLAANENILFLPGIFNEAMWLLLETHDYFQQYGKDDQERLSNRERSIYCCEMSRITMRLSCIMAWLMVRKAVYSGKLATADAVVKYRLDCRELCLHQNIEAESMLPTYMNHLLDRTFELYRRICRLDDDMATRAPSALQA